RYRPGRVGVNDGSALNGDGERTTAGPEVCSHHQVSVTGLRTETRLIAVPVPTTWPVVPSIGAAVLKEGTTEGTTYGALGLTDTRTVAGGLSTAPSETTSWNSYVPGRMGVNWGKAAPGLSKKMRGPPVWVQP